jgi:uncharacterized damage-inducible protein DinB
MRSLALLSTAFALVTAQLVQAQSEEPRMPATLREGLLTRFDEASGKIIQLAEAIPADKYQWRPTPQVRTVSEVLVHVGAGNYYTLEAAGVRPPVKVRDDEETTTTAKPQVIEFLKRSNEHMRKVLGRLKDRDLTRPATMFEQKTTVGNVYLFGVTHLHEHMGQLVSYARLNGVVPPWSMKK